ncbi:hypothetical protein DPEC_G00322290 [Dallia pectoralis]|uniref:Uncharacterized protein n=1 Tax=Dallia pectoralis TaxID=75939 RepID=A0ACC2FAD4_DALPE|nr:hypothetical protein DPEC_G00322290 [Dallia pectoralis]
MHIIKEEGSVSAKREDGRHEGEVSCAQVSILQESCSLTGVGEAECALSIVPVKIKSKKSDKYVTTYAFLDPGSTATFCTEELQRKLNIKGKPTRILLSTMGQDKPGEQKLMNSFVISDLEVCGLEETLFIELPKVFTHSNIPVYTGNIPEQSDIQKWSYLNEPSSIGVFWFATIRLGSVTGSHMNDRFIVPGYGSSFQHVDKRKRPTVTGGVANSQDLERPAELSGSGQRDVFS